MESGNSEKPLVSVIIPSFNNAEFVEETLKSVLNQSVENIEVLVVDDASTDGSAAVIQGVAAQDPRVRFFQQEINSGVSMARNRGLSEAKGRYIAYLDSDDIWKDSKLELQLQYMQQKGAGVCITGYDTIEEDGAFRNSVRVPKSIGYKGLLKNSVTCSHTLMVDTDLVARELLQMPDLRRGQDFATWLQIAKAGHLIYGHPESLAQYRKRGGSLSSDKFKAIKRTWNVYRNIEHLSRPYAVYCQFWQTFNAIKKRI